jgi:LppX_LprAFG lipoprotein
MVGRFASALAFLFVLTVVLGSAGCGDRFDELGAGQPPAADALVSQALTALEDAGSAHVVIDADGGSISGTNARLGFHFEGDVSKSALTGDAEIRFPGGTLGARVLVGDHDVYVRFAGTWYHESSGIADTYNKTKAKNGDLLAELTTPAGLGKRFAELVTGAIVEGPDVDGASTWKFDGRFRADAFARFIEEYGQPDLTANDRAQLEKVADASRVVFLAGRDDHLPRRIELTLDPPKDLRFDSQALQSSGGPLSLTIGLSDFGGDVSFTAPKDVKPLDALFEQFFAGIG